MKWRRDGGAQVSSCGLRHTQVVREASGVLPHLLQTV